MHPEAKRYVAAWVKGRVFRSVLEFGSLNINGTVRDEITHLSYFGVDPQPGPGVDFVADAVYYRVALPVDLVVCCEVLEHASDVPGLVRSAFENLRPGGVFLVTCATDSRDPHSAVDGGPLRDGEHYANVEADTLVALCREEGFVVQDVEVDRLRGDLYLRAKRP